MEIIKFLTTCYVKKSCLGPPFSRSWADLLGCAARPAYFAARAGLGSRGAYLVFVKELEGRQQICTLVSKPKLL
jgi:hypothetical protein